MRSVALAIALLLLAPLAAPAQQDDTELSYGAQTFQDLKDKHAIVASSPLYDTLRPIAQQITRVIQPQYPYPVHFYIVRGKQPNAFAAPGGNVYVVDSLFYFVRNREELAGTLCHETSHLLHHDSMNEMSHDEAIRRRQILAAILLGGGFGDMLAISAIGDLDSLHYSRQAEERADLTGADTCAQAGLNPWGLVWLFRDFSNVNMDTPPEILTDHPNDQHRIAALEQHLKDNPALFARYNGDRRRATPLHIKKNAPEKILE